MRVLFVDHTDGHDPKALYDKPTGGILTSLTKIPEYLAAKGHDVYVQSTYAKQEDVNGVHYILPETKIPKWDAVVFNRNVLPREFVKYNLENGVKVIWWLHDIVDTRYLPDDTFKAVDHIVALSEYCKQTYSDFYDIPQSKFTVIPNGIDPEVFYPGAYENRNPHLYITASALIKGIMPLDVTFMNLYKHDPDLDFRIYSSQALHGHKNSKAQQEFLDKMQAAGAHVYHPVSQSVLAHIMRKAWALLMPNSYPEICSNLLLQARACGLPVVTTDIGANKEWAIDGENALSTTKYKPHDIHSWIVEFATKALDLTLKPELHKKISTNAPIGVPTWEGIGDAWDKLLKDVAGQNQVVAEISSTSSDGGEAGQSPV